ncbi:MAG: DUF454 domain-containing protein [Alphaproteobacteria bacterium]|nr:DUF454 domain-containing protein [Alphaproteobacteria bacterium]
MFLYRVFGGLFLAAGAVGLFLPVWPTTIFWILAALCFARSNPDTRDWIYARPGIGPQIEAFVERGTISRAGKLAAVSGIALAAAITGFLLWHHPQVLIATGAILVLVVLFIVTRKED